MRYWIYAFIVVLIFAAVIVSCGRGQKSPAIRGAPTGAPSQQAAQPEPENIERNALVVVSPDLSGLPAGAEFDVRIDYELTEELYQMSGRLIYNRQAMQPVRVVRGSIPDSAVFFSKLDHPQFVPFAFTQLDGAKGIQPGAGNVLTVRFRLTGEGAGASRVRLLNEAEFLQLRASNRGRLSFDLEHRTVAK